MSKIKEYLQNHIERCYMLSKVSPYNGLINYAECLDMVYLNAPIDVTQKYKKMYMEELDTDTKVFLRYDKENFKIITDFVDNDKIEEYLNNHTI